MYSLTFLSTRHSSRVKIAGRRPGESCNDAHPVYTSVVKFAGKRSNELVSLLRDAQSSAFKRAGNFSGRARNATHPDTSNTSDTTRPDGNRSSKGTRSIRWMSSLCSSAWRRAARRVRTPARKLVAAKGRGYATHFLRKGRSEECRTAN